MKKTTENRSYILNNIPKILLVALLTGLMCLCLGACGSEEAVEETVEITTPAEETTATSDESTDESSDAAKDADSSEDANGSKSEDSGKESDAQGSQYEKIYKDCDKEMKDATAKYMDELEDKAGSSSKSGLYDETQDRIEALKEIYDGGKDKMIDAMLKSTEDDVKEYDKYFKKMSEAYTEYSRELTSVYTESF